MVAHSIYKAASQSTASKKGKKKKKKKKKTMAIPKITVTKRLPQW
jgi:hypothetical protein